MFWPQTSETTNLAPVALKAQQTRKGIIMKMPLTPGGKP
jgi:hypothetical protein